MKEFYVKMHESFLKVDKMYYDKIANIPKIPTIPAVTIFALIYERIDSSMKNKASFTDKYNKPYVIFTNKEMEGLLNCSRRTCYSCIKGLENANLIRVFRKSREPNHYYVNQEVYQNNKSSKRYYRVLKNKFDFMHLHEQNKQYIVQHPEEGLDNLNQIYILSYLEDLMRLSASKGTRFYDDDRKAFYVILDSDEMSKALHISKHTIQKNLSRLEHLTVPNYPRSFVERIRQKNAKSKIYLPAMLIDSTQLTIRNQIMKANRPK